MTPQGARIRTPRVINPADKWITLKEAADRSAVNIRRINQAIKDHELKLYCLGWPVSKRVMLSDVHRWWRGHRMRGEAAAKARQAKEQNGESILDHGML